MKKLSFEEIQDLLQYEEIKELSYEEIKALTYEEFQEMNKRRAFQILKNQLLQEKAYEEYKAKKATEKAEDVAEMKVTWETKGSPLKSLIPAMIWIAIGYTVIMGLYHYQDVINFLVLKFDFFEFLIPFLK